MKYETKNYTHQTKSNVSKNHAVGKAYDSARDGYKTGEIIFTKQSTTERYINKLRLFLLMAKEIPKIKADDFVYYDEIDEHEKFTNFQELSMKVELLIEAVDELAHILRDNGITRVEKIEAQYFDEDELYQRLEEE